MPIVGPTTFAITIGDLANEVIARVENRTSDAGRAYVWLRDALLEVTSDSKFRDEFDELEVVGPLFNLIPSTQEYVITPNLITSPDANLATLDVLLWIDYPTNSMRRRLDSMSYQDIDRWSPMNGTPNQWYRFGDNIGFNPIPDQAYQVQARYLRQHPIADVIDQTEILIPVDWHEILVWAAVQRGFAELLEFEKSSAVSIMLHGDPRYPDRPGLMYGRKKRREREDWRKEKSLRPMLRPYSQGGY